VSEIRIPFRGEDDLIVDVVDAARETMDGEELQVTEAVAFDAMARGTTTARVLLEELESPENRRAIVDRARQKAGLPSLEALEEARAITLAARDDPPRLQQGPPRDGRGRAMQECAAEGCTRISLDDHGNPGPVAAKRFFCPAHVDQAEPGDLEPLPSMPMRFAPGGGLAVSDEEAKAAALHYERLVENAREQGRIKREQRERESERLRALEEARRAEVKPLAGWGG
jgi:hypothetical protein